MINQLQTVRLHVTSAAIEQYAALSNDFNPIHLDANFARDSPFGGIIAHGTLSLNLIWEAIEITFGAPTRGCHVVDIRFKAPVRVDDWVEAGGERQDDGVFQVWVRNQHGDRVIEGTARIDTLESDSTPP